MLNLICRTLLVLAVASLSACASGYREFYRPNPNLQLERVAALRFAPPTGQPIVERSRPDTADRILDAYSRRGYVMIGNSMFNSGRPESEESAVQQGVAVEADLILILNPTYTGSVTSSLPITAPTATISNANATATAYGRGGPVTAYGSGTTTTYGTQTSYIPMTVYTALIMEPCTS